MFIDLKELKQKVGAQLKLKLKSSGIYMKKEYSTPQGMKSFNIYEFQVEQAGSVYTLGASDSLKRKLDDLDTDDEFMLSWEEFTKDGQLRNYWKVEGVPLTKNEFDNYVAQKSTDNKIDPIVAKKVVERSTNINNGARLGMIFNNTMTLYKHFDFAWNTDEFVKNFKRIEELVNACENAPNESTMPKEIEQLENHQSKSPIPKPVKQKAPESQTYNVDDLPF
jgi:hypothetical protein